jgi:phosphonate transport system substrate-binding protein
MRLNCLIMTATVFLAIGACAPGSDEAVSTGLPQTVRVGLIPNIAPEEQKARYAPVSEYLSGALDREVELFVASDYSGVVAALASARIDVA